MNKRLALVAAISAAAMPIVGAHATPGHRAGAVSPSDSPITARPGVSDAQLASGHPRITHADVRSAKATRALTRSWPGRVLRARQAAGGAVVVVDFGPSGDDAVPISDVNHDGAQEVLQARLSATQPALVVLSGATGRPVWTRPGSALIGAEYAAVPGGAGVVLAYSFGSGQGAPGPGVDGGEYSFVVTGVDAATGHSLWTQSFPATWLFSPVGAGAMTGMEPDGVLARKGQAPLLLLDNLAFGESLATDDMASHPVLLDVSTGQVSATSAPSVSSDGFVYSQGVGDVNADGTDDVATVVDGDLESLSVWSGASGQPLWSTSYTAGFIGFVASSPDIDGDKARDLLVGLEGADPGGTVQAVAGTSGTVIWQHAGDYGTSIGDVDHDGRSDTRLVRFGQTMAYAVVNAKGKDLWHLVIPSPYSKGVDPLSYPAGDVNGDGVWDIYLRYVDKDGVFGAPVAGAGSVLVDGATGHARRLPDLGVPLGASADGRGDDFYRSVAVKGRLVTSVADGRTARVLWRRTLREAPTRVIDSSIGLFGSPASRQIVTAIAYADHELVLTQTGRNGASGWASSYQLYVDDGLGAIAEP